MLKDTWNMLDQVMMIAFGLGFLVMLLGALRPERSPMQTPSAWRATMRWWAADCALMLVWARIAETQVALRVALVLVATVLFWMGLRARPRDGHRVNG
ncbi:MAG: hypothetical protein WCK74_00245 [Gemmatimonadaceae bacterium]